MKGISDRWREHHRRDYGRDGLVVLCVTTRETVPERARMSQEDLALAMEQKLLHHYLLSHPDPRVVNETFTAGHLAQHNYHAYAVYMAFRYEDTSGSNPSTSSTQRKPIPVSQPCRTEVKSKQKEANPQLSSPTGSKNKAPRQNHISPPKSPKPSLVPTPSHAPSTTHSSPTNLTSNARRSLLNYQPGGTRVNLQPTATSNTVPVQTTPLASSKRKQPLNSKRKVPPKRPRSASSQTPSKTIELSSNAPSTVASGPSNTTPLSKKTSGLEQIQKSPTTHPFRPPTFTSTPLPLPSPVKLSHNAGRSPQQVRQQPTASSNAVPVQTTPLASSKGKQPLNSKCKVPQKHPRSASGQTPSKMIELSSNAPSSNTAPLSKIPSGKGSLKQTQKRPTNRQHSTPSIPSGPSRPPTFTSTPLPSPVKLSFNAGRSPQQVSRQPTASSNTVPAQTTPPASPSKGKQPLGSKRKVPPKRPRSASSQTPSKKIKLSYNVQKHPTKCSSRPPTFTSTPLHEQHVSRQPTASTNTVPAQTTSLASSSKGKHPLGSKRKVPPKCPRSASNHTPIKLSSNAPYKEIAPGPSNTTPLSKQPSGLKQTQKRSAIRQHSTSTPSIPRKSTPLPSSSPAKRVKPFQNAGRSPQQVSRQPCKSNKCQPKMLLLLQPLGCCKVTSTSKSVYRPELQGEYCSCLSWKVLCKVH